MRILNPCPLLNELDLKSILEILPEVVKGKDPSVQSFDLEMEPVMPVNDT